MGLDLTADITYKPSNDISTIKCSANYKNDYINIDGSVCKNFLYWIMNYFIWKQRKKIFHFVILLFNM